ncbi:MAG: flavin reductase family protein, partial [Spirochaetales bacterium]|nr:flavin reductase family protein [Spirochaetales bacterium]
MRKFTEISPEKIKDNLFKLIDKDWMLVTAGTKQQCNMMTASWGGVGILWNLPVAFVFIRPQRYTDTFIQRHDLFSLCFFNET